MSTLLVANIANREQSVSELTPQQLEDMLLNSPPNAADQFRASVAAGFVVQPEGITLALGDRDRGQFTQMLALIDQGLGLGQLTDTSPQKIADVNDVLHDVTTLRFRQIMLAYGAHYKGLWDALKAASA